MSLPKPKTAVKAMNVRAPNRVTHTYKQRLNGSVSKVFPLLYPVREAEWIHGWSPVLVLSQSGYAEQDCVFITDAKVHDSIWYVTRHDPARGYVEMIKVTPGVTACKLTIRVRPAKPGCEAEITYSHTSLGPEGDVFVVWQSFRRGQSDIYLKPYSRGAWSAEIRVSESPANDWEPAVAAAAGRTACGVPTT